MKETIAPLLGWVLACCRTKYGWTKRRLATALGWKDDSLLTDYERGGANLLRPRLLEILAPLPLEDPELAVDALAFAHELSFPERLEEPASPTALSAEERKSAARAATAGGLAVARAIYTDQILKRKAEKAEAARREAEAAWVRLQAVPPEHRRDLIAALPEFRGVALVARVCEASVRAAARKPSKARELAELALFIAERVEEPVRSRAQGSCWAFIGNSRRVTEDFDGADEAFVQCWKLWEAGTDCELLRESRLLDLEASLRLDERRFPQALKLLDLASP